MPLHTPVWSDFMSCPICYVQFDEAEKPPVSLGCGHTICSVCLLKLRSNQCPFDMVSIGVVFYVVNIEKYWYGIWYGEYLKYWCGECWVFKVLIWWVYLKYWCCKYLKVNMVFDMMSIYMIFAHFFWFFFSFFDHQVESTYRFSELPVNYAILKLLKNQNNSKEFNAKYNSEHISYPAVLEKCHLEHFLLATRCIVNMANYLHSFTYQRGVFFFILYFIDRFELSGHYISWKLFWQISYRKDTLLKGVQNSSWTSITSWVLFIEIVLFIESMWFVFIFII